MWFMRCAECPKGLLQGTGFLAVEWYVSGENYSYMLLQCSSTQFIPFLFTWHCQQLKSWLCMCVCWYIWLLTVVICCLLHVACRLDMHYIISSFFCAFTFTFLLKWFIRQKRTLTTDHCRLLKVFSISFAYIFSLGWEAVETVYDV